MNSIMDTQTLCRICFELGHFSLNEYEVNVQGTNILIEKMLQRFSDVEIVDPNAPEMICETCTHDLVQCYIFIEKVQQADGKILNLCSSVQQEEPVVFEEVQSQEDADEEEETIENPSESEATFCYDTDQSIKEIESNIIEEIYVDTESPDGSEEDVISTSEIVPTKRKYNKAPQIVLTEGVSNLLSNYKSDDQPDEPKRKIYCRKKDRLNKEIDDSGSFIITQFTPSCASKLQMDNIYSDDTDEVTLSDIRTMNFEAVEIKAGNINVISEDDQGELPIDDSRVYLCQYCPKAFSSSPFLISHVRKSHGCKYCARMFEKSTDLFKHIRESHTSFKCVVCEKDFVSNSNLRNHLKTVHKLKVPANVSLLSYKRKEQIAEEEEEIFLS